MRAVCLLSLFFLKLVSCKHHAQQCQTIGQSPVSSLKFDRSNSRSFSLNAEILATSQRKVVSALNPAKARALLVSCAALYGSNYPLTKLLQDALNPAFVTTLRFVIASVFFLPSTIRGLSGEANLSLGSIELGIWCSIGFISQAMILTKTSASKAAFFCGLSVLMPPIFALVEDLFSRFSTNNTPVAKSLKEPPAASLDKKPSGSVLYKLMKSPFIKPFLALCGAAILEWGSGMESAGLSDLALLITPVSFAMCFWRSASLGAKYPDEIASITGIMLSTVAVLGIVWSSVSLNFCCSAAGGSDFPAECSKLFSALSGWKVIAGLLYSGIFTTAFTSYVEQQVIRVLTPAETTLIYTLEPLFATAFAAFVLSEHVSQGTYFGAAFIISACLWDTAVDYSMSNALIT